MNSNVKYNNLNTHRCQFCIDPHGFHKAVNFHDHDDDSTASSATSRSSNAYTRSSTTRSSNTSGSFEEDKDDADGNGNRSSGFTDSDSEPPSYEQAMIGHHPLTIASTTTRSSSNQPQALSAANLNIMSCHQVGNHPGFPSPSGCQGVATVSSSASSNVFHHSNLAQQQRVVPIGAAVLTLFGPSILPPPNKLEPPPQQHLSTLPQPNPVPVPSYPMSSALLHASGHDLSSALPPSHSQHFGQSPCYYRAESSSQPLAPPSMAITLPLFSSELTSVHSFMPEPQKVETLASPLASSPNLAVPWRPFIGAFIRK